MIIRKSDVFGQLSYRGEGNANLVISLKDRKTILRFPKSKFIEKSQLEKLEIIARYVNEVMRPELAEFVDTVAIMRIGWDQLDLVRNLVIPSRPQHRLVKDIYYPAALVMPDYSFFKHQVLGPVLAIEIKPKQGFYLLDSIPAPGLCSFCLKQYYKFKTREIKTPSYYCPLDLFSGDGSRMFRAITSLFQSPQNNLRLFKDGELLHSEETIHSQASDQLIHDMFGSENVLASVICKALSSPSSIEIDEDTADQTRKLGHCKVGTENLSSSSILSRVLKLQRRNSLQDNEADNLLKSLLVEGFDLVTLQCYVTRSDAFLENSKEITKKHKEQIKTLKNYLISVTAKDLSMILTIVQESHSCGNKEGHLLKIKGNAFRCKWSIVDLDPKNLNRISKYVEQKETWLQTYTDYINCDEIP